MAEESVRDFVRSVRGQLQEKGPFGAFVLAELDAAISRGVDERDIRQPARSTPIPADVIGRRAATDEELLGIVIGVLSTYLGTLPAVVGSLTRYLNERHQVEHVEIALDPSLLGDETQGRGRTPLDAAIPRLTSAEALGALRELQAAIPEIIEGVE